ncbi:MAG: nucleoside phosphorylase [Chitinophagales bacterium]
MEQIAESELVLHPDGSIYHLHLHPEQIADTIILVGDPSRVEQISRHFDNVQERVQYREFITHTGHLNNKRLSVVSTGISTDNIDITLNELDALVNIDLKTREVRSEKRSLEIIRLGTSGAVNEEIPIESVIVSETGIGLDGLLNFYEHQNSIQETVYLEAFNAHIKKHFNGVKPYIASGDERLLEKFEKRYKRGTTLTASGFYGPQGRTLRAKGEFPNFIEVMNNFRHKHFRITNLEMETAAIYGLGKILGHRCASLNVILANRVTHEFSSDPKRAVEKVIDEVLEIITT